MSRLWLAKYRVESARLRSWDYRNPGVYFVTICTKEMRPFFGSIRDGEVDLSGTGKIAVACVEQIPAHHSGVSVDEFVVMPNHVHILLYLLESPPPAAPRGFAPPQAGSLSSVVQAFKAAVTKAAHRAGDDRFAWQSRFHDRVVRDERGLSRLREYVRDNPVKWEFDRYYWRG